MFFPDKLKSISKNFLNKANVSKGREIECKSQNVKQNIKKRNFKFWYPLFNPSSYYVLTDLTKKV